ncbi:MAG: hypothetical protein WC180_06225, partial [Candidatus Paceibacterota bacterium]
MRKIIPAIIFLLIMLTGAYITLSNADKIDSKPINPPEQQVQIIKVKATAFNIYGHDVNGIDYGPGYVIISTESEIPLYSLLDIDIYGPCQAVGVSPYLTKDEVKLWYNGTSKVT